MKLSTKVAVFKRESLLIGGAKHVDWGVRPPLGAGPAAEGLRGRRQLRVQERHCPAQGCKNSSKKVINSNYNSLAKKVTNYGVKFLKVTNSNYKITRGKK